jgi:hypothetical protein
MLFSGLFYCIKLSSIESSLYVKKCSQGSVLVFNRNFYACEVQFHYIYLFGKHVGFGVEDASSMHGP